MRADREDPGSGSHTETNPPPPYFLGCGCWGGFSSAVWMNLEQTDRVRAETANESSSESASGDSIRFLPWGEGVELCFSQAQVGSRLRSPMMQAKA